MTGESVLSVETEAILDLVLGVGLAVANGIVFLLLVTHQSLRKKYVLFALVIFHSSLTGVMCILQGTIFLATDADSSFKMVKECLINPIVVIDIYVYPMNAITLFTISVDRLLVVAFPLAYYRYCHCMVRTLLIASISVGLVILVAAVLTIVLSSIATVTTATCRVSDMMSVPFFYAYVSLRIIFSALSIVVMFIVVMLLRRPRIIPNKGVISRHSKTALQCIFEHWQMRFTRTMLISCAFTFVLFVLPEIVVIAMMVAHFGDTPGVVRCVRFVNFLNSFNMLIVAVTCQKDIRRRGNPSSRIIGSGR